MLTADQAKKKTLKVTLKENKELLTIIENNIRQAISTGKNHIHMNIDKYLNETSELANYLRSLGYCVTREPKTRVWYIGWK